MGQIPSAVQVIIIMGYYRGYLRSNGIGIITEIIIGVTIGVVIGVIIRAVIIVVTIGFITRVIIGVPLYSHYVLHSPLVVLAALMSVTAVYHTWQCSCPLRQESNNCQR